MAPPGRRALRPEGGKVGRMSKSPSIRHQHVAEDILAKSRARFKVGRWSESNKKIHDMMIDMAGSKSLPQLIQQVHHYLLMVNSKPEPSLN